jgi:hypothetical protein
MQNLWVVALDILLVNLPFGFWRAGTRKFSLQWFLAVHVPVPFVVGIRFLAGFGLNLTTFPVFIFAYFTGQYIGGKIRS